MIAFWTGAGGWIVVMYGALNNIPKEVIEAARVDGAGAMRIAWSIQIPLMRKWIAYMVIMSFAGGTQLFVEPRVLAQASRRRGRAGLLAEPARLPLCLQADRLSTARRRSRWCCWSSPLALSIYFVFEGGLFERA